MNIYLMLVLALYFPAGAGLIYQSARVSLLPERIMSLALAIFCIELARMAVVDLHKASAVSSKKDNVLLEASLNRFRTVVTSTIVLELIGFYLALLFVSGGASVVICSQLWFNLWVNVQLWPGLTPEVIPFALRERIPVLLVNLLELVHLSLWRISSLQIWLASGMFALILLFLMIK